MNQPNYPASTSAWYAESYYTGLRLLEVENLCSECGKPCDEPTCTLCLEGIAEMIAIMDQPEESHGSALCSLASICVFFGTVLAILTAVCR